MFNKSIFAAAMLAATALVPAAASATSFDFTSSNVNTSNTYGNVRTFTGSDGSKVEASAYSLDGSTLRAAFLGQYVGGGNHQYGLGVINNFNTDDNHAIDNSGWTDFVVLQFDKMVSVSQLGLYGFGDTDLTWAVGTTATPFAGTLSFANFTALDNAFGTFNSSGGSYSNSYQTRSVNGTMGNLFLVSASAAGSNDIFKLSTLVSTPAVPEPATWGMMMMGLGLAGAMMRRSKANTAVSFA